MNILTFFCYLLLSPNYHNNLETIYADFFDCKKEEYSDYCANSIQEYKNNVEFWGIWSLPIGEPSASSNLPDSKSGSYTIENIIDYDLNTAWVPKGSTNGIGESFEFEFNFPDNTEYAGAYQFFGICSLFNGYCKSLDIWQANSRVKKLKVYYNDNELCYVILKDSWHFQSFDIGKYFINKRDKKYLNANYKIENGDVLKFEIVEVYKGSKYSDVAISEFLCEGAGN